MILLFSSILLAHFFLPHCTGFGVFRHQECFLFAFLFSAAYILFIGLVGTIYLEHRQGRQAGVCK
jgi:hypothetical protein